MTKRILVTGHRGAAGLAPENTIAGFQIAVELGCDAVELDVHLTKDGQLAVIHDDSVERTTNGTGKVAEHTMAELQEFDAGEWERIPTLSEVFDLLDESGMIIQIELKGVGTEIPAAELTRKHGMEKRVRFTSFYHQRVLAVRKKMPSAQTGILISCNPADPGPLLDSARADNLHVNQTRIDRTLVDAVRAVGKRIIAWGKVEDDAVIDRLIDLGVDGIGSNRPDRVILRLKNSGREGWA